MFAIFAWAVIWWLVARRLGIPTRVLWVMLIVVYLAIVAAHFVLPSTSPLIMALGGDVRLWGVIGLFAALIAGYGRGLAYLKSRLLLPDPEPEEQMETLDMAEALRRQLLQLEAMRKAGKELMALPRLGVTRFKGAHHEQFNPVNVVSHTATLFDLLQAYGQIASREEASTLTISASHLYSVEEAVARLGDLIKYAKGWNNLLSFLPPNLKTELDHRSAIASHFTATLEMVRDGQAQLRQDNQFGPIYLASTEEHI